MISTFHAQLTYNHIVFIFRPFEEASSDHHQMSELRSKARPGEAFNLAGKTYT